MLRLFAGFELVEPGLVGCASWRSSEPGGSRDSTEMNTVSYGGSAASRDRPVAIQANLRDVEAILDYPQTQRLLDLDQPGTG